MIALVDYVHAAKLAKIRRSFVIEKKSLRLSVICRDVFFVLPDVTLSYVRKNHLLM